MSYSAFFPSLILLYTTSALCFVLSMYFYFKTGQLKSLSNNLSVTVFNKSFNVFDPLPKGRTTIHKGITLLWILTMGVSFTVAYLFVYYATAGILILFSVVTVLLMFLMIDVIFDVRRDLAEFTRSLGDGKGFANGDLALISRMKPLLPRLSLYYLCLSAILIVSAFFLPQITSGATSIIGGYAGALFGALLPHFGILTPWVIVFPLITLVLLMQTGGNQLRSLIFGFSKNRYLEETGKQFELMKEWVRWSHHELAHRLSPPEPDAVNDSEKLKQTT